jgi:hypothetical protein
MVAYKATRNKGNTMSILLNISMVLTTAIVIATAWQSFKWQGWGRI